MNMYGFAVSCHNLVTLHTSLLLSEMIQMLRLSNRSVLISFFLFSPYPAVSALNVMYSSLNSPSQLGGWKSSGGDPCGDSWEGIKCSGSYVTEM